jgi:Protein of unknown function (DUF2480)
VEDEIINRVKGSSLVSLDLDEILPEVIVQEFDLSGHLFQGMVLREKDFRIALKTLDLKAFEGRVVAVHCSTDAIIPLWAYMLVSSKLSGIALRTYAAPPKEAELQFILDFIHDMDLTPFREVKVVIKGCSDFGHKEKVYNSLTERLVPVVQSLMYGEPCSTVPVYKRPKV